MTPDPISWESLIELCSGLPISMEELSQLLCYPTLGMLHETVEARQLSVWHVNGVLAAAFPIAVAIGWKHTVLQWPYLRSLIVKKLMRLEHTGAVMSAEELAASLSRQL